MINNSSKKQKFTIIVRLRPSLAEDYRSFKPNQIQTVIQTQDNSLTLQRKNNQQKTFRFNEVFDSGTQQQIYQKSQHLVEAIFDGYNSTFLAYGQTGTGKTHTVFGSDGFNIQSGYFYNSVRDIFQKIKKKMHLRQFAVRISFVEFYLDNIYDLIANNNKKLQIKQNGDEGIHIKDLSEVSVKSQQQLFACVRQAIKVRKTQQTSINKRSSRSHAIIQIALLQRWNQNSQTKYLKGLLKIVDLAGSERVSKTQSNGNRLQEAKRINKQITTLGKCINMLAVAEKEGKIINSDISNKFNFNKSHIPFRDSKITRFLSQALQGKSRIILCVCVSKFQVHIQQTFSSLMFASQASTLKIDSKRNQIYSLKKSIQKTSVYQTPLKYKAQNKKSTTPIKNFLNEQQKNNQSQIKNQKYRLLQKFKKEIQEIDSYLHGKQIKNVDKQQKEIMKSNLLELDKIFGYYRNYTQRNSYQN